MAALHALLFSDGASAAPRDPQYKDVISHTSPRGTVRIADVEVLSESYEKVEWKSRTGAAQSRPANEVISIVYGDSPRDFETGMEAWRTGRYADAIKQFQDAVLAVQQETARPWCSSRSKAFIGDSKRHLAERSKNPAAEFVGAVQVLEEAHKEEPKSPILDMVLTSLARAQAGAGQHDRAVKTLDELTAAARAAQKPLWEAEARLTRGSILERKGDIAGAAQEYADLAQYCQTAASPLPAGSETRTSIERMRTRGLVLQAWAAYARAEKSRADGDISTARGMFDRLVSETGGAEAGKAAARNGQGALALLKGDAKAALEAFLEVEVLRFAVPEEVTRALWYKAQAYGVLGNAKGKDAALKDLVDFYPWSEWADRAR
jgi:tetratricopeptide (TPR) repeat protein